MTTQNPALFNIYNADGHLVYQAAGALTADAAIAAAAAADKLGVDEDDLTAEAVYEENV